MLPPLCRKRRLQQRKQWQRKAQVQWHRGRQKRWRRQRMRKRQACSGKASFAKEIKHRRSLREKSAATHRPAQLRKASHKRQKQFACLPSCCCKEAKITDTKGSENDLGISLVVPACCKARIYQVTFAAKMPSGCKVQRAGTGPAAQQQQARRTVNGLCTHPRQAPASTRGALDNGNSD